MTPPFHTSSKAVLPAALGLAVAACAPESPPSLEPSPADYEVSATRPITDMPQRTIGFLDEGVWLSNEFEGGRMSDAWREGDSLVVVHIAPENAPVNNSAWYAFKVWSAQPRPLQLRLTYEDGSHRYWPKVRRAGSEQWVALDSAAVEVAEGRDWARVSLEVGPDTVWVATLDRSLETDPPDILDPWLGYLESELPHYEVSDSPSMLTTPMSRNWFYREFRTPGLIYEVGDDTDRALIREVAGTAARGTMLLLLEAYDHRERGEEGD